MWSFTQSINLSWGLSVLLPMVSGHAHQHIYDHSRTAPTAGSSSTARGGSSSSGGGGGLIDAQSVIELLPLLTPVLIELLAMSMRPRLLPDSNIVLGCILKVLRPDSGMLSQAGIPSHLQAA